MYEILYDLAFRNDIIRHTYATDHVALCGIVTLLELTIGIVLSSARLRKQVFLKNEL